MPVRKISKRAMEALKKKRELKGKGIVKKLEPVKIKKWPKNPDKNAKPNKALVKKAIAKRLKA